MKKRVGAVLLVCLMMVMPLVALAEVMYVNTSNGGSVNMRSGPSSDDEILTTIPFAAEVNVIDMLVGSSWVNVSYNGYYGFVSLRYLTDYPPPAPNPNPWPTFVPAPTSRPNPTSKPSPTKQPSGGSSLEKTLAQMFANFKPTAYEAVVVPSTPTNYVNLRWAPSKSAPVRAQYWAGNLLHVLSENGTWAEVYDASTNTYGYMMTVFLKPSSLGSGSDS